MSILRALVAAASLSLVALAPGSASAADAEATKIAAASKTPMWNWTPPGKSDRYGHSETLIKAKASAVKAAVQDFSKYKEFNSSRFKQSKVLKSAEGHTDVYLQVSALKGMVTLWNKM